jgi:predicted acetyltransferase
MKDGGHIGYAVVPEFRKQGVATKILEESLRFCRKWNIQVEGKVLVTCDDDNIGSIKTIEKNGGMLLDKINLVEGKPLKRRYWITL